MEDITEKAKKVLIDNTGFRLMRVSSVSKDKEFSSVDVDVLDGAARPGGIVRTYRVAFDTGGELHGYSLISYRIPRLRGEQVRSLPCS